MEEQDFEWDEQLPEQVCGGLTGEQERDSRVELGGWEFDW